MAEKYKIVLGKDLEAGQTIIHDCQKFIIKSVGQGCGAGSLEWNGDYIHVDSLRMINGGEFTFWTYPDCPMIVKIIQ